MEELVANAMASVLNEEEFAKRLIIQELMQKGPSVLENLGGNDNKQKKNKKKNKKSNFDVEMATNLFEKAQKQAQEQQLDDCDLDSKEKDEIMYDDGDQSKVVGVFEQQKLQSLWSSGE